MPPHKKFNVSYARGCELGWSSVACVVIRLCAGQMTNNGMIPTGARGVRVLHLCPRAPLEPLFIVYQRLFPLD